MGKFSPPEKDQKYEVSLSEVLQHYKNVTQESSNKKRKAAEDNGYEDAEEEEFWTNKKPKMDLSSTECYGCGKNRTHVPGMSGQGCRRCPRRWRLFQLWKSRTFFQGMSGQSWRDEMLQLWKTRTLVQGMHRNCWSQLENVVL